MWVYCQSSCQLFTPIELEDRTSVDSITVTEIGLFGLLRKARPNVPQHLHTGIDIKRPTLDYQNPPPIFSIAVGKVISIRRDGPYAQVIIEHQQDFKFWTVYEHIADVTVSLNQQVHPFMPIARFYTEEELNRFGWQFDHFHFEILKEPPIPVVINSKRPEHHFRSYTLNCYDQEVLKQYFYDPLMFLERHIRK